MRSPAQMLADQVVDGHASLHDGEAAASLGLIGAPIEGPTHFSQFDPLAVALWGQTWFERGCISSHFRTMVVEGEDVQASMTTNWREGRSDRGPQVRRHPGADGNRVNRAGSPCHRARLPPRRPRRSGRAVHRRPTEGRHAPQRQQVGIDESLRTESAPCTPFSLASTSSPDHRTAPVVHAHGEASSPWGRPGADGDDQRSGQQVRQRMASAVAGRGLFLDLEIRMLDGPVFVNSPTP